MKSIFKKINIGKITFFIFVALLFSYNLPASMAAPDGCNESTNGHNCDEWEIIGWPPTSVKHITCRDDNKTLGDYVYKAGGTHYRAEVIRGRVAIPAGWGKKCAVGCSDDAACGNCECRCQGENLYCADIVGGSSYYSQSCKVTVKSAKCIPSATITSPANNNGFDAGTSIFFDSKGADPIGESIVGYKWVIRTHANNASKNYTQDIVRDTKNFSLDNLKPNNYYVFLRVRNEAGAWSAWKYISITVKSASSATCGNGTIEGAEQCDDGVNNNTTCAPPYGGTCSYCSMSCIKSTIKGSSCGDKSCDGSETCATCSGDCGPCKGNQNDLNWKEVSPNN